jgi:hypothetical protein
MTGTSFNYGKQDSNSSAWSNSNDMSASSSLGYGQSTSTSNIAFADLFKQLYSGASAKAFSLADSFSNADARSLFNGGTDLLKSLQKGPADEYLSSRLTGANEALESQIASLKNDAGDVFSNKILPALTRRGIGSGTFGGSRGAIAEGQAAGELGRGLMSTIGGLRSNDMNARDSLAQFMNTSQLARTQTGLSALPGLFDLQQGSQLGALAPYQSLAQILGGPTVLSDAQSTNSSISDAFSQAIQQSGSTSRSKGRTYGLGLGV